MPEWQAVKLTFFAPWQLEGTPRRRGWQIICVRQTWHGCYLWACMFCFDLQFFSLCSGLLQKDVFKGRQWFGRNVFQSHKHYCHACHTGFAVFFPILPSYCVSLLKQSKNPPLLVGSHLHSKQFPWKMIH